MQKNYKAGVLVIYHNSAAIVTDIKDDKISLKLKNGKTKKVRDKDILFLHEGPINNLKDLEKDLDGDIDSAWELLDDEIIEISDLADFIFNETTPLSLWKAWEILQQNLYFIGTIEEISRNSKENIDKIIFEKEEKAKAVKDWEDYIQRVKSREFIKEDLSRLKEIEQVAFAQNLNNKTLKFFKIEPTPQKAHKFLIRLKLWNDLVNPYLARYNCALKNPNLEIPELPNDERVDLTHLETFAIDSAHTHDPDDAVSLDGKYLWVHIADVASLIMPNSELDIESRRRGSTLYIPEKSINMIPTDMVKVLGLGLTEKSPALSFKLSLNEDGDVNCEEIVLSFIKVKRITYKEVDDLILEEPFLSINNMAQRFRKRRKENGSLDIILPDVDIHVDDKNIQDFVSKNSKLNFNSKEFDIPKIDINNVENTPSREMVQETMLMTGSAVADWLYENKIPIPYAVQSPSDETKQPNGILETLAFVKTLKKSKLSLAPGIHSGLGIKRYVRVTSPLRRYSDLLVHQQIRAYLLNKDIIDETTMEEKMTEAEFTASNCSRASRLSNKHWKLFYIKHISNKEFKAILVDKMGHRGKVIIPELAIDAKIQSVSKIDLGTKLDVVISDVSIENLELFVKVKKS